jgi:fluoride exporter
MSHGLSLSLMVGIGGFAGSVARYGLSIAAQRLSIQWPAGTLAANIIGCLVIGSITGIAARGETLSPEARLVLATGFCGGFTTMSSLVYETAAMIRASEYLHACLYAAGTFILSMGAFAAGVFCLRMLARTGGGLWS